MAENKEEYSLPFNGEELTFVVLQSGEIEAWENTISVSDFVSTLKSTATTENIYNYGKRAKEVEAILAVLPKQEEEEEEWNETLF